MTRLRAFLRRLFRRRDEWPPCTACGCIHDEHHTYGVRSCCPDCEHSDEPWRDSHLDDLAEGANRP